MSGLYCGGDTNFIELTSYSGHKIMINIQFIDSYFDNHIKTSKFEYNVCENAYEITQKILEANSRA